MILLGIMILSSKVSYTIEAKDSTKQRIYGENRYETAARISEYGWKNSDYVILASGEGFADALSATPLAKKYNAPIMLTKKNELNEFSKNGLSKLKVKNVIIVGGQGAVSDQIEKEISGMNIGIRRICGINRYETSLKIAQEVGIKNGIVITNGTNFADAISIASIAAEKEMPVLLVPGKEFTKEELEFIKGQDISKDVYLIGGPKVVSENIQNHFRDSQRIYGNNRYETNAKILEKFSGNLDLKKIYITSGSNYPDALAISALTAIEKTPLLLVSGDGIPNDTLSFVEKNYKDIKEMVAIGGPKVVTEESLDIDFGETIFQNAETPLDTPTYDGSNQAVHPKIIYFKDGWNGYKYWLGITPYPYGNDDYENPQLLVSNDGVNFKYFENIKNPLFIPKDIEKGGHYSDIHLCVANNSLEIYFRYNPGNEKGTGPDNRNNQILMTMSKDGKEWTEPRLVLDKWSLGKTYDYVSPIIIYEEGKYKIWFSNYSENLYYTETTDWISFSEVKVCTFKEKDNNFKLWHHDIIKTDLGYEIIISGYKGRNFNRQNLYHAISEDGINFSNIEKIMSYSNKVSAFDNQSLYRGSLLKVEGKYYLYYSARDTSKRWRIGLSYKY